MYSHCTSISVLLATIRSHLYYCVVVVMRSSDRTTARPVPFACIAKLELLKMFSCFTVASEQSIEKAFCHGS